MSKNKRNVNNHWKINAHRERIPLIYIYVYKKISLELREFFKITSLSQNATLLYIRKVPYRILSYSTCTIITKRLFRLISDFSPCLV